MSTGVTSATMARRRTLRRHAGFVPSYGAAVAPRKPAIAGGVKAIGPGDAICPDGTGTSRDMGRGRLVVDEVGELLHDGNLFVLDESTVGGKEHDVALC